MPWKPQSTANGIRRKTAYYLGGLAIRVLFLCLSKYRHECRCTPRVLSLHWLQVNGQLQAQDAPPPVYFQQEAARAPEPAWTCWSREKYIALPRIVLDRSGVYWAVRTDSLYSINIHLAWLGFVSLKGKTFATWNRLHAFVCIMIQSWYTRIHATVTSYTLPCNFI